MLLSLKLVTVTAVSLVTTVLADDACNDKTKPAQIRLAYAGDRGMSVSWNTNQSMSKPTVYFGTGSNLDRSAWSDVSITYPTSSTWNNHVTITGLEPDTRYHYKIACDNRAYSFITARPAGQGNSFKFAMVGDMGTMGPDGLSTTVGTGAANPLLPGENNSIQSLHSLKDSYEFVWHGMSHCLAFLSVTDLS